MKAVSHQKSLFMYLVVQFISTPTVYADKPEELTMAQQAAVLKILSSVLKGSSKNSLNSRTFPSKSSKLLRGSTVNIKKTESFMLPEKSVLSKTKGTKNNNLTNQPPQTVYNDNSQSYHIYGGHQTDPQIQELLKEINNLKQSILKTSPDAETKKALLEATLQASELKKALEEKNRQEELIKKEQQEIDNKYKELQKTLDSNTASNQEEVTKLKSNIQTLENKASSQEEALKQKDSELQKKVQEVELKAEDLKKIQAEKQTLSSKLETLQSDLEKSKQEAEKILQEKIAALESEKNKDSKTQTEISELTKQLETIKKEKVERDQELTKLKTEIENSNKKAAEFEKKVTELEATKNEVEKNKALSENEKETQLKNLQTVKIELENKIQLISTENEKKIHNLTEEMSKDKKELEQVKAENASLKQTLEETKKNQNEVTEKAQQAGKALQEKIKNLEEEKKNLEIRQSSDEGEKDKRISELTEKINNLTKEKNNLDNTLQTEQKKFNEASQTIETINKEIEKLKQSGEDHTTKINQLEKTAKTQTELLTKAQKELLEKTEEANLLAARVMYLDNENQRLTKELYSLNNDKESYNKNSAELQSKLQKEINELKETKNLSEQDKIKIQNLTAENENLKKNSHEIELSYKKLEEVSDSITKDLKKKTALILQLEEQKKEMEENFKKAKLEQNSKDYSKLENQIRQLNDEKTKLESEKNQALENLKQKTTEFEKSLEEKELKITELNNTLDSTQSDIELLKQEISKKELALKNYFKLPNTLHTQEKETLTQQLEQLNKKYEGKISKDSAYNKLVHNQLAAENRNLRELNTKNLNEAVDKLKDPNLSLKHCEEIKSEIRKLGQSVGWSDEDLNKQLNPIDCHQTLELKSKTVEATHLPQKKHLQISTNTQVNIPAAETIPPNPHSEEKKKIVKPGKELPSVIPEGTPEELETESPALTDLKKKITDYLDQPENGEPSFDNIKNIFDNTIKTLPSAEQKIVINFIKAQISRRQNPAFSKKTARRKNTSPSIPSVPSFEEMEEADNKPGLEDTNHINIPKNIGHSEVLPQKEIEDPQPETIPEENSEPSIKNLDPDQKYFQEMEKVDDAPAFTKEDLKSGSKIFWVIGPDDLELDKLPKIPQEPIRFNNAAKQILVKYPPSLSTAIDDLMDRKKYLKGQSFDTIQKQSSTQKIFHRFTTDSIKKIQFFLDELKQKVIEKIQTINNTKELTLSEGGTKMILLKNWKDFLSKIDTLKETVKKSHQKLVKSFAENKYPLQFKQWTGAKVTNSKKHLLSSSSVNQSIDPGIFNKETLKKPIKNS